MKKGKWELGLLRLQSRKIFSIRVVVGLSEQEKKGILESCKDVKVTGAVLYAKPGTKFLVPGIGLVDREEIQCAINEEKAVVLAKELSLKKKAGGQKNGK